MFQKCDNLATVTISSNVTSISENTFYECPRLTSINIPSNVMNIGKWAFRDSGLTSANVNASIIEEGAFYRCESLTSLTLSSNVTSIGVDAFQNCNALMNIVIPSSVTYIGASAFSAMQTGGTRTIKMMSSTPPTIEAGALNHSNYSTGVNDLIIKVPVGSLNAYKTAENWSAYAEFIVEGS